MKWIGVVLTVKGLAAWVFLSKAFDWNAAFDKSLTAAWRRVRDNAPYLQTLARVLWVLRWSTPVYFWDCSSAW